MPARGAAPAATKPPPRAAAAEPDEAAEAADGFGEDKTFVIEASAAGVAMRNQVTEDPDREPAGQGAARAPHKGPAQPPVGAASAEASSTGKKPSARPDNTNDDYLNQVSLYDDEGSNEDDSRTLVSAANPFFEKGPTNQQERTGEEDDEIDASEAADEDAARSPNTRLGGELSDAPTMMAVDRTGPGGPPAGDQSATRTAFRAEQAPAPGRGATIDPVAAAMAEEERLAAEIVRGSSRGVPPSPPPMQARGNDVAGRQLPAIERTASGPAAPSTTALALPAEPASDMDALPVAPHTVAALPKNLVAITMGAVALSLVLFMAVTTAGFMRYLRAQSTTLTLYAVGAPPPSDVKVTVDGTLIGGLPSSAQLREGEHTIVVEGTGIQTVTRPFRGAGGAAKQPVLIIPLSKVASATDSLHDPGVAVEPKDPPTRATGPREAPPADPATHPVAPPASSSTSTGGWRLSVAAVADDSGIAIAGAEVFVDGVAVGRTPFEGEVAQASGQVEVQIKKAGYVTRSVKLDRGERSAVGPATVRLPPGGDAATATPPGAPGAATPPPTDPATVAVAAAGTADKPPVDKPPVDKPPVDKPPVDKPPVDKPPVDKPPVDKPPVDKPPVDKPPVVAAKSPPTDKPKTGTDKPPADATDKVPASKKLAQLQIGTQPFAETIIDGKSQGATPFYNTRALKLSLGTHKVDFVDKATGKKYHYRITILEDDPENKAVIILGKPDMLPKVQGKIKVKVE